MTLENSWDRENVDRGRGVEADVRRTSVEGIVDTGAVSLVIPKEIATELGLRHWGTRTVVYADERREQRPVTDVTIEIGNLATRTEAVVGPAGSQVLIGQVVLETLDLIADCKNQTLAPRHPEGPVLALRSYAISGALTEPPESLFCASLRILEDGEQSWRRHLLDCVDAVRRSGTAALLATPPATELSARLRALAAGIAETLAAECGTTAPEWTSGVGPLDQPWFVSGYESLKASALLESPVPFRSRNVFVLANFLERA